MLDSCSLNDFQQVCAFYVTKSGLNLSLYCWVLFGSWYCSLFFFIFLCVWSVLFKFFFFFMFLASLIHFVLFGFIFCLFPGQTRIVLFGLWSNQRFRVNQSESTWSGKKKGLIPCLVFATFFTKDLLA